MHFEVRIFIQRPPSSFFGGHPRFSLASFSAPFKKKSIHDQDLFSSKNRWMTFTDLDWVRGGLRRAISLLVEIKDQDVDGSQQGIYI
jgi:hypothetical protein